MITRTRLLFGIVAGVLFTAPLMALLYLAEQAQGLPFVPFDLFDWLARVLPGDIIIRSIETMVDIITRLNLGETDTTAKTLESLSALAMFFGGGVVAGALLFLLLDRLQALPGYLAGIVYGLLFGLPLMLISLEEGVYDTTYTVSALWLALLFGAWGAALHWLYAQLQQRPAAATPAIEPAAPASGVMAHQISRRAFLVRVGGATATLTVIGAGIGRYLAYLDEQEYQETIRENRLASEQVPDDLPNAGDPVQPAPGTRPEYTPLEDHYRIDINLRPAEIDGDEWRLKVSGMVDEDREMTLDELKSNYTPQNQYVTLACISNPVGGDLISTILWTGASLRDILPDWGLSDEATHLKISSADGFFETVALDLIESDPRIMLTYNWDGIPLLQKHGYPLRIYIPDRYGMKQPKWITDIEAIGEFEEGYWVKRGWDKEALMKATSVVDVAASDQVFEQDGQQFVPVGGIAHAGARGISKVEVRVDGGEWVETQLRAPISETTWVIWRYDWPFAEGEHTFEVRCYEGDGTLQPTEKSGNYPDGATGIHSLTREI